MNSRIVFIVVICCNVANYTRADNHDGMNAVERQFGSLTGVIGGPHIGNVEDHGDNLPHDRTKRTLFLKKKILGAGLLGFGLGAIKGYKAGYRHAPEVHHVYVAPPSVKYVEYVEKPVYIEKIVDGPVFQAASEYGPPRRSPSDLSPSYGSISSSSSSSSSGGSSSSSSNGNDGYW